MTNSDSRRSAASEGLKACPFCGPGQSMVDPWFDDVSKRWAIGCGRCGASSGRSVHAEGSKEAAIKSWNTRGLTGDVAQSAQVTEQQIEDGAKALFGDGWDKTATPANRRYCREKAKAIFAAMAAQPPAAPVETQRCAECRCEKGAEKCEWIAPAHSSADNADVHNRPETPHWERRWPHDQPNGWNRDADKFLALIKSAGGSMWLALFRAKYLEMRIDTRDCGFNLYDRDGKPLNPDDVVKAVEEVKEKYGAGVSYRDEPQGAGK